jgi:DNA processing protein
LSKDLQPKKTADRSAGAAAQEAADEELVSLLAMRSIPGLGNRLAQRLVKEIGSAAGVFHASPTELDAIGLPSHVARAIAAGTSFDQALKEAEAARQKGAVCLTFQDPRYPDNLREIFDPPLLLYAVGDLTLLELDYVGVVGSRKPTAYGRAMAQRISTDLAAHGLGIISGLARGIDAAAHQGALDVNGKTIAVLGAGVDVVYPAENKKLYEAIAAKGLLLSEFPLGTFPAPQNFPIRNRVISGLSAGVLVVEAAEHSGSLITARLAMEQNREVFAVPGSVTNKNSWGPHLLIKQGAMLVQDWQDVVENLPSQVRVRLLASAPANGEKSESADNNRASLFSEQLSETERAIYELLKVEEAAHIDELLNALPNYSSSEVLASLLELEFKSLLRQLPGKNFVKTF